MNFVANKNAQRTLGHATGVSVMKLLAKSAVLRSRL